jgi:hypothetical protein
MAIRRGDVHQFTFTKRVCVILLYQMQIKSASSLPCMTWDSGLALSLQDSSRRTISKSPPKPKPPPSLLLPWFARLLNKILFFKIPSRMIHTSSVEARNHFPGSRFKCPSPQFCKYTRSHHSACLLSLNGPSCYLIPIPYTICCCCRASAGPTVDRPHF